MSRLSCLQCNPCTAGLTSFTGNAVCRKPSRRRCQGLPPTNPSSFPRSIGFSKITELFKQRGGAAVSLPTGRLHQPCLPRRAFSIVAAKSEEGGEKKHVIVCGGGVIGVCTAYYLSSQGAKVTIVEKRDVASGASGKAGGLLGLDWYEGLPMGELARLGFLLHADLARQLDGPSAYKYAPLEHITVDLTPPPADLEAALPPVKPAAPAEGEPDTWDAGFAILGEKPDLKVVIPPWLDGPVAEGGMVNGTLETIALLHPGLFTKRLLAEAKEMFDVTVHTGAVERIVFDSEASPGVPIATGVVVDGVEVAGDAVVVAMGPWSGTLEPISSLCRFRALRGDSIVLRPKDPTGPLSTGPCVSLMLPESVSERVEEFYLMPRSTGEVYAGGINRIETVLPDSTTDVTPDPEASRALAELAALSTSALCGATVEVTQACLRPFAGDDSLPLIGVVPDHLSLYVGTGHGYWGILCGPATGFALSELILTGTSPSLDLAPFNPGRFVSS